MPETWTKEKLKEEGYVIDENSRRSVRAKKVGKSSSDSPKQSKYRNVKCEVDGITFDSKREGRRYIQLKRMELAGLINNLEVNANLSPKIEFVFERDGVKFGSYQPDFRYYENGREIIEDAKGKKTKAYINKRRLMKEMYGISIRET